MPDAPHVLTIETVTSSPNEETRESTTMSIPHEESDPKANIDVSSPAQPEDSDTGVQQKVIGKSHDLIRHS